MILCKADEAGQSQSTSQEWSASFTAIETNEQTSPSVHPGI